MIRVKPIVWSIDEGRTRALAQRIGHSLSIAQNGDGFAWQLQSVEGPVLECGDSATFDGALVACTEAWECYIGSVLDECTVKPMSWNEQDTAYGANNTGFTIEKGSKDYIVIVEPEQTIAKHHFGFRTLEEAKAWCERYNKETVEEAMEWLM